MSHPDKPERVKLVSSLFAVDRGTLGTAIREISACFGRPDFISEYLAFDATDYYAAEMGRCLVRRFVSFEELIDPESLAGIKLETNRIEAFHAESGQRRVNIDPGYVSLGHLILATGKSGAHRPYLRDGIYADLTLLYQGGSFKPLEWSYPDYADAKIRDIVRFLREKYRVQLRLRETGASAQQNGKEY